MDNQSLIFRCGGTEGTLKQESMHIILEVLVRFSLFGRKLVGVTLTPSRKVKADSIRRKEDDTITFVWKAIASSNLVSFFRTLWGISLK